MSQQSIETIYSKLLVISALNRATMEALQRKGIFTTDEAREIYEAALVHLEAQQANAPAAQGVFDAARSSMETQLRNRPRKD